MNTITTFYTFMPQNDCENVRFELMRFCSNHNILGTILISHEGLNGTVMGANNDICKFEQFVKDLLNCQSLEFKQAETKVKAFDRLKIKIKPEIITFKEPTDVANCSGKYLSCDSWNQMLEQADSIIIDTRNDYEYQLGTFKNAINPNTENFSDLPAWLDSNLSDADKNKNIMMFCTGGVRCEKSTAYLKQRGFANVYHLEGGIIKYLQTVKPSENKFKGDCFVFDNRITVNQDDLTCCASD